MSEYASLVPLIPFEHEAGVDHRNLNVRNREGATNKGNETVPSLKDEYEKVCRMCAEENAPGRKKKRRDHT